MSRLWQPPKADRAERLATAAEQRATSHVSMPTWAEGYAEGLEEGRRVVELELAADRAALAELVTGLEALQPPPNDRIAALIADTVFALVAQVAGDAPTDRALLTARATAAAQLVSDEAGEIVLRVHPDDAALIGEDFPARLMPDTAMARGSVCAEANDAWAADGVTQALVRVRSALGL